MSDVEFDFHEFTAYVEKLEKLGQTDISDFCVSMANELAAELLRKCIKRTPVDTGTLRRNWRASDIRHDGDAWVIEVSNETLYASYVEYGHRQQPGRFVPAIGKRLKKSWVNGRFMMTISTNEIQQDGARQIERALQSYIERLLE